MKKYTFDEVKEATLKYFDGDELAADVWIKKYCLKDSDGNLYEKTPDDMHHRLAKEFARIEKKYPNPMSEEEIYGYLKNGYMTPQGRPMAGIGNNFSVMSISNCFVIGYDEDVDSYGSILKLDQELVQIAKRSGGIGLDISFIRPKDAPVNNSALTSTGIVPFMERYSNSTREVGQNNRRGANIQTIDIRHYQVEDFIKAKADKTKITGSNISVKINDEFMEAVKNNSDFELKYPINSDNPTFSKKVKAVDLWKSIVEQNILAAEPGVVYENTVIKESLPDCYADEGFKTLSVNPCFPASEYILTEKGYFKFGDLFKSKEPVKILADNRISYSNDSPEERVENWKIDASKSGVTIRQGSEVFLTKENAELLELETKKGFLLRCTPDHHIATDKGMVEAKDLTSSHKILVSIPEINNASIVNREPSTDDEISALLMGLISGDGTFSKPLNENCQGQCHLDFWGDDSFRIGELVKKYISKLYDSSNYTIGNKGQKYSNYYMTEDSKANKIRISSTFLAKHLYNKYGFSKESKHKVPEFIMNNAISNIGKYYLAGLMYTDGSIQGSIKSSYSVRLAQSNKDFLRSIQLLFHANGLMFSLHKRRDESFRKMPDGKGGLKDYFTKANYELISCSGSIVRYMDMIGFLGDSVKTSKFNSTINYRIKKSEFDTVVSINKIPNEDVYCIKEDIGRNIIVSALSSRRCGEIVLSKNDSCRLFILNLSSYVLDQFTENAKFDFELFATHAEKAQRLMDDIVDLEVEKVESIIEKIESDPEPEEIKAIELNLWKNILEVGLKGRRTGLGFTGLGDAIAKLNIAYGESESIAFVDKMQRTLNKHAYKSSIEMAKERGSFPIFNYEKEKNNPYLKRVLENAPELKKDLIKYGRRNIALLTNSPTGSTSIILKSSSGVEPIFMTHYKRRRKILSDETKVDFIDANGDKWQEYNVFHPLFKEYLEFKDVDIESVSEDSLSDIIKGSPFYYTAHNINYLDKVDIISTIQKYNCHAISNTTNLPKDITFKEVSDLYMTAHEKGCKGLTIYVDGSRDGVLVSNDSKETAVPNERPETLECDIHHVQANGKKFYVLVGLLDDKPYEIFAFEKKGIHIPQLRKEGRLVKIESGVYNLKYNGTTIENISQYFQAPEEDSFTRMISLLLRRGISVKDVVEQLEKSYSFISSFYKVIERTLRKNYMSDEDLKSGKKCSECGSTNLAIQEGCLVCLQCGSSKCG